MAQQTRATTVYNETARDERIGKILEDTFDAFLTYTDLPEKLIEMISLDALSAGLKTYLCILTSNCTLSTIQWYHDYESFDELQQIYGSEWRFRHDIDGGVQFCCVKCVRSCGRRWTVCSADRCSVVVFENVSNKFKKRMLCTDGLCPTAVCLFHKFDVDCSLCGAGVCDCCREKKNRKCTGKRCPKIFCMKHVNSKRCDCCLQRNEYKCHCCTSCELKQFFHCPICWMSFCPKSQKGRVSDCDKCGKTTCDNCCVIVKKRRRRRRNIFCRKCATRRF